MLLQRPVAYDTLPYTERLSFMARRAKVMMNNPSIVLGLKLA